MSNSEIKAPLFSGVIPEKRLAASTLARYPANRHPSAESIESMRLSLLENGQLQPITVRPSPKHLGKEYEIIFGETRAQAALKIDPSFLIRCYVLDLDDAEAARIHAVENFQRKQLDPLEEAEAMENMRANGWEVKSIAASLDIARATVHRRLRLLKLNSKARSALRKETLQLRTAEMIASLEDDERELALQLVLEPAHSPEPLSQERAHEEITEKIIRPRIRKLEWEARREELCKAFPESDFLTYKESEEKTHWSSGFESCSAFPDMDIRSPRAKSFDVRVPTWGELAAKHGAKTFLACPEFPFDTGEPRIIVDTQPLIEAELLAFAKDIDNCVFSHSKQIKKTTRDEQAAARKRADEEYRANLKKEMSEALSYLARPDAVLPSAAEDVCVEIFKEYVEDFNFKGGSLPGFENPTEEEILANGAKYLRAKEFGGFSALARLYIVGKLDQPAGPYAEKLLGRMLIGTQAIRKEDFPMLAKAWADYCADELKKDEARLESGPERPM